MSDSKLPLSGDVSQTIAPLSADEEVATRHLETMVNGIADVKERQGAKALLQP